MLGYAMLYGMFFLMSFALEHGYGDSPVAAGLRLAVIPVALGIVAPFSGGLSDRIGARLLSAAGMAVCVVALVILALEEADPDASRLFGSAAFALFGAGLGVFIAPNNHETIKAAPASLSGEAGSLLNLMRALGTSLGVASASSTLSWRLQATTGAALIARARFPATFCWAPSRAVSRCLPAWRSWPVRCRRSQQEPARAACGMTAMGNALGCSHWLPSAVRMDEAGCARQPASGRHEKMSATMPAYHPMFSCWA